MISRLYREDAYLVAFEARVTSSRDVGKGRLAVELDRTAFYPTGGGQPHDTGRLAGLPVIDVRETGDGGIDHIVRAAPSEAPDGSIRAEVDWARRFDHMQQHTGQHILSRAFVDVAAAPTLSFHLGETTCTIDVDAAELTPARLRAVESRANEVVFSNVPVGVTTVPAADAVQLAKEMELVRDLALRPGDPFRLIEIDGFDRTPCGGTHVRRAGETGGVAILQHERFKGTTRVEFVCGSRVIRHLARLQDVVSACVGKLSAPLDQIPETVDRLQSQLAAVRRELDTARGSLADLEAGSLAAEARDHGGVSILVKVFDDRGVDQAQAIARRFAGTAGRVALVAARDASAGKAGLVFVRSEQGVPPDLAMGEILSEICAGRGGRGGGNPVLARGGLPAGEAPAALEEAFATVSRRLASRRA